MSTTLLSSTAQKIESFRDLFAWQQGHEFVLMIYRMTKAFPTSEQGVSITSNIAEGFSRNSFREKLQFYATALGSLTETQNQLLIAKDVGYVKNENFQEIFDQSIRVNKLINGLIKKTKTLIPPS